MPGLIRPPFGAPTGPLLEETELISSFMFGARTGHSDEYHIEEFSLLVDRLQPVAIRLQPGCALIRTDVTNGRLERASAAAGLTKHLDDPQLATVVSLQSLGLPAASWDLWCIDDVDGGRALELAVVNGPDQREPGHP